MKISELESRLKNHAIIAKNKIATPFDFEREEMKMVKKKLNIKKTVMIAAAVVCLFGTTAFAAVHYLNAKDVATTLGESKLAQEFSGQTAVSESETDGEYKASVLGVVSGDNLAKYSISSNGQYYTDRTYAVVAVEKADGTPMTYEDEVLVTPLISGLEPWRYNIFSMHGQHNARVIDGVLYRIVDFDNIEYFADREVYMAVLSEAFYNRDAYNFDNNTGMISVNEDYEGTNILFKMNLDKSKANPEKAQAYIESINK